MKALPLSILAQRGFLRQKRRLHQTAWSGSLAPWRKRAGMITRRKNAA